MVGAFLFIFVILIIPKIFFLKLVFEVDALISIENRRLSKPLAALFIIPSLGFIGLLYCAVVLSNSIIKEYQLLNRRPIISSGGKTVGILAGVFFLLIGFVGMILWIIYWSNLSTIKQDLRYARREIGRNSLAQHLVE